jgi:hypothetical protein
MSLTGKLDRQPLRRDGGYDPLSHRGVDELQIPGVVTAVAEERERRLQKGRANRGGLPERLGVGDEDLASHGGGPRRI